MDAERRRLESLLATHVRSYLGANAAGDEAAQEEELRYVCSVLEHLVPHLLADRRDWPPGSWIDGFSVASLTVPSPLELTIKEGSASLVDPNGEYWAEPFFAALRLEDELDHNLSYRLSLGDAARGLRKVPCSQRIRRWPEEWIFTMSSESETP